MLRGVVRRFAPFFVSLTLAAGTVAASGSAAHAVCSGPSVLVIDSDSPGFVADVVTKLDGTCRFSQVDSFDAGGATPSLVTLETYDAVLVSSNNGFSDRVGMGDVLADYVDAGHTVVVTVFALWDASESLALSGRIVDDGYVPYVSAPQTSGTEYVLVADDPASPLLAGVNSFDGGTNSYFNEVTLAPGATQVAHWSDPSLTPLVMFKGDVVALNFFPPSSDARPDLWDASTDGATLMANALGGAFLATYQPRVRVGADQISQTLSIAPGEQKTFHFTVTNDGSVSDSFTILGEGSAKPVVIRYFHGRNDITDAVRAGTYTSIVLGPGRSIGIKLVAYVRLTAPGGITRRFRLIGTSVGDPTATGAAFAKVSVP